MMYLSIIIPTLNEAKAIAPILQNLQWARAQGHELILVDGGSEDETLVLAEPWVDQLLSCEVGRARQLNMGGQAATHHVLLFLHADTNLTAQALEACLAHCYRESAWGRFDVRLSGEAMSLRVIERSMNWRSRLTGIATGDQGIFMRRELFEKVGGFPLIPIMEDIRMSQQLNRESKPVCLWQQVETSSRRWEKKGPYKTIGLMWLLRLAFTLGVEPAWLAARYEQIR